MIRVPLQLIRKALQKLNQMTKILAKIQIATPNVNELLVLSLRALHYALHIVDQKRLDVNATLDLQIK